MSASTQQSTVYIGCAVEQRYVKAKRFGELQVVYPARLVLTDSPQELVAYVQKRLASFNPERDYLLVGGHSLIDLIAADYIVRQFSIVKLIYWDSDLHDFTTISMPFMAESKG